MYEGRLVRLRECRIEDAQQFVKWLNDYHLAGKLTGGGARPMTVEQEEAWLKAHGGQQEGENHFAIETLDGRLIGNCGYRDVDWQARRCMVGWFIGEEAMRGHGYGTDMICVLLRFCFEELGMHKVSLEVFEYNEAAVRLYERLGFVREGVFRDEAYRAGRYWNRFRYGLLREEWEAHGNS